MKKALLSAIALLFGIGLIYMPSIPDVLFPKQSAFDNIGTLYVSDEKYPFEEPDALHVSTADAVGSADEILADSFPEISGASSSQSSGSYLPEPIESSDSLLQSKGVFYDGSEAASKVWLPNSGKKYHSRPDCSGMKNPSSCTLQEATDKGFTACKKCFKSS